jgi:hypothetical protein
MTQAWLQAPPLRRLLFVLGNLVAGLGIVLACVVPVSALFEDRDREILQQRVVLARLQAVASREPSVRSQAKQTALGEGEFLTGKTDGAVGADLQTRLKSMVEAAGAKLRSVRSLQPKTDAQMKYIGSHIELVGPIAAIHRAVHAIESAKPYLLVAGGTIRLTPPIGHVGIPREPVVEAQLDVFGAVRIEGREP